MASSSSTDRPLGVCLNNLGVLHSLMGDQAEAKVLYRRVLEIREALLGTDHPDRL